MAKKRSIPIALICDAGKTQIAAGTHTVLALLLTQEDFEIAEKQYSKEVMN